MLAFVIEYSRGNSLAVECIGKIDKKEQQCTAVTSFHTNFVEAAVAARKAAHSILSAQQESPPLLLRSWGSFEKKSTYSWCRPGLFVMVLSYLTDIPWPKPSF